MIEYTFKGVELSHWTVDYCTCSVCPYKQKHQEFIPVRFGPITLGEYNRSRFYGPLVQEQLKQQIILHIRLEGENQ